MADGSFSIEFAPSARRELAKLPRGVQTRVKRAIDRLAVLPRPRGAKRLTDSAGIWRIRVGDYRVLYEIHDDRLVVIVIRLGHRRDVYRGM